MYTYIWWYRVRVRESRPKKMTDDDIILNNVLPSDKYVMQGNYFDTDDDVRFKIKEKNIVADDYGTTSSNNYVTSNSHNFMATDNYVMLQKSTRLPTNKYVIKHFMKTQLNYLLVLLYLVMVLY